MDNKDNLLILIFIALLVIILCKRRVEGFASFTEIATNAMNTVESAGKDMINKAGTAVGEQIKKDVEKVKGVKTIASKANIDTKNENIYGYITFENSDLYRTDITKALGNVYPIHIKSTYKDIEALDEIEVDERNPGASDKDIKENNGEYPIVKDVNGHPKKIYLKTVLWLKDPNITDDNILCITRTETSQDPKTLKLINGMSCNIFSYTDSTGEFDEGIDPDIFHGMVPFKIKTFFYKEDHNDDYKIEKSENLIAIRPITHYEKYEAKFDIEGTSLPTCKFDKDILDQLKYKNREREKCKLNKIENSVEYETEKTLNSNNSKDERLEKSCRQLKCYSFDHKDCEKFEFKEKMLSVDKCEKGDCEKSEFSEEILTCEECENKNYLLSKLLLK